MSRAATRLRSGDRGLLLEEEAIGILQDLIRVDTTNPPGGETAACRILARILAAEGLDPVIVEPRPGRGSLVARLKGTGEAPPILLTGHLDVVPARDDAWSRPPFSGDRADGFVWGRGSLDCKGVVVQALTTLRRLKRESRRFGRDVIFAAVADEERGSRLGAHHLVENQPDLVRAEYALGELGGIGRRVLGRDVYPIQVAEKGATKLKVHVRGLAAHGAIPSGRGPLQDLAGVILDLTRNAARIRPTPQMEHTLAVLARGIRGMPGALLSGMSIALRHRWTRETLVRRIASRPTGSLVRAMMADTVSITGVETPVSNNTAPDHGVLHLDVRRLPGTSMSDLLAWIETIVGRRGEVEVISSTDPVESPPRGPMYECLAGAIREGDPGALVVPWLMPGGTDAKAWSRLGTLCYGFSPVDMRAHPDLDLASLYHGVDERIPEEGFRWGLRVHHRAVYSFLENGGAPGQVTPR